MNIFTRSLTDELASLVSKVDAQVAEKKDEKLVSFVVLLTDDPDKAEGDLKAFAKKHGIKNIPLTYFDGVAGPAKYKIAKEADVTVNMWLEKSSKANHAFAKGALRGDTVAKVIADIQKILE